MGTRIGVLVMCAALVVGPMSASAASPWTTESTYPTRALGKLQYGLTNTLFGWTALLSEPYQMALAGEAGSVGGVTLGLVRAIWYATGQTVGGAVHLTTFPLTFLDVPLPDGGTDFVENLTPAP